MLLTSLYGTARAQEEGTLLLVREWHADTGMLTGWLPLHSVMVSLQLADPKDVAAFDPNEAVYVTFMNSAGVKGGVLLAPEPRVLDGHRWEPVERDANLVRIKKQIFILRAITFEGSPSKHAIIANR
jgi:hypothetical protein